MHWPDPQDALPPTPMTAEDRLRQALELSPRFYDAALDPSKWPAVLRDLRQLLRAEAGQFNLSRLNVPTLLLSYGEGMTKEQENAYQITSPFSGIGLRYVRKKTLRTKGCT